MIPDTLYNDTVLPKFESVMVGRERELNELKQYLDKTIEGKGGVVLIEGEVGIGKTRLVFEAHKRTGKERFRFLVGRCLYQEEWMPYMPFVDAFKGYFTSAKPAELDKHLSKIENPSPSLGHLLPVTMIPTTYFEREEIAGARGVPFEEIDPPGGRGRMFETITQLISNIAEEKPLVLFLDDLHWADFASLQLLHYVAQKVRHYPVLICGAYRPEELTAIRGEVHRLTDVMQRMSREKLYTTITLEGLSKAEVGDMIKALLEGVEVPDNFVEYIYKKTGGNPFFVEEVLKSVRESPLIDLSDPQSLAKVDLSKLKIPCTIKDVITRRLNRLDEDSVKTINYAALIGRRFNFNVLREVLEWDEERLLDSIDKLISVGLIREDKKEEDTYIFEHLVTMDVVSTGLSRGRERYLHRKIGDMIERLNEGLEEGDFIYDLAYHYHKGGEWKKAMHYAIRAGERARGLYASEDAIKHFKNALEALEALRKTRSLTPEDTAVHIDLMLKLGDMYFVSGEWKESSSYYEKALQLSEISHNTAKTTDAYRKIGHIKRAKSDWDAALQNYNKSLKIAEASKDHSAIAMLQKCIGDIYFRRGEHEMARYYYFKYIDFAQRIQNLSEIATANVLLGNSLLAEGKYGKAIKYYKNGLGGFETLDNKYEITRTHLHIGEAYKRKGEYAAALKHNEKCIEISKNIGYTRMKAYGLANAGEVCARLANFEDAKVYLNLARELLTKIDDSFGIALVNGAFGVLHGAMGEFEEAIQFFKKGLAMLKDIADVPLWVAYGSYELGLVYIKKGEFEEARKCIQKALDLYKKLGNTTEVEECEQKLAKLSIQNEVLRAGSKR